MNRLAVSLALVATLTPAVAAYAQAAPTKHPMTFEDMMKMKRLGETAVSPDGKWLVYGVTSVDLEKNSKTTETFIQAIAPSSNQSGEAQKLAVTQPGDSGVQFAADGKRILFLSSRGGSQQVWLADFDTATGTASNPRKLTNISTEADNAKWAPDSKSIVFTSAVYPDCPAITLANGDAGDKCNADKDGAAAASKVKAQIFTQLLYRHWNHYTGEKRSHLFLASAETGAARDLNPNDPHDVPPFSLEGGCGCDISPDSKELAFTGNPDAVPAISTSAQIYTLDLTNPAAKPVKISTSAGGNFTPAYSPDGKYLAWRSQERAGYESDKFRLMLYDRAAKTTKDLLPKFDRWIDEFAWEPDSKKIYFVSGHDGHAPVFAILESGIASNGMGLERFETPNQEPGEYSSVHILPDNRTVLATRMTVRNPSEIVLLGPYVEPAPNPGEMIVGIDFVGSKRELEKLISLGEPEDRSSVAVSHLNDSLLKDLNIPAMQSFWFTAQDGTKIQGFLIPPPGFDPQKKYPVKFLIHGGPQGAWGDAWSYRWNAELFAANGYVVVMINPRGSTGYGQAFVDGVNGDWGGKPFSDLMEGLDTAERKFPFIDKTRECALGASYGGYMANWILGHTDRFKCIVSHDGMFNPESAFGSTEELWFNTWEFKGRPWDYFGKPDSENPFRKWAPMLSAKNFKTPTLVIHGQLDYRLDVSEGFQLFTALQLMNVPSKMLYFPDEGHWVLKPQNSQLWYKTVNDWVDKWTAVAR